MFNKMKQVTANTPLKKPTNFEEARETESKCVKFAKEVKRDKNLNFISNTVMNHTSYFVLSHHTVQVCKGGKKVKF